MTDHTPDCPSPHPVLIAAARWSGVVALLFGLVVFICLQLGGLM